MGEVSRMSTRGSIALPMPLVSPRGTHEFLVTKTHDPWGIQTGQRRFIVYRVLKFIVIGVTLFPIRFLLLCICLLLIWILLVFGTVGRKYSKQMEDAQPRNDWQLVMLRPIRFLCRVLLWCFGVWWIREDIHKGYDDPCQLIVGNHVSLLDVIYIFHRFVFCPVAKAEILSWPLFGRAMRLLQGLPVDRHAKDSKTIVRNEIQRRSAPGSGFPPILVFPEGTTTNGRVLIHFKNGPFAPGQPVRPLCLQYPFRFFDTGNTTFTRLLWMMFEVSNNLHATLLPVYTPSESEKADPDLYASNIRTLMAKTLDVPVTQHSYEDLFLYATAQRAGVAQDFEMAQVRSIFEISLKDVEKLLLKFKELDRGHDGLLTVDDFSKTFGYSTPPPHIVKAFEILDSNQTGRIDFRQFLYGLAILHDKADSEQKISLAFSLYDLDGNGRLSQDEVKELIEMCRKSGLVGNKEAVQAALSSREALLPQPEPINVQALFEEFGVGEQGMDKETFERVLKSGKHGELLTMPLLLMKSTMLPKSARGKESQSANK
eukprot:c5859_g1_i1.p1 GENE.c5859_g1_i1~~c5859_g1_i1.p1  ORF type:complete len:553 (-),score=108.57 c5859_g1_i1:190-1812(-)